MAAHLLPEHDILLFDGAAARTAALEARLCERGWHPNRISMDDLSPPTDPGRATVAVVLVDEQRRREGNSSVLALLARLVKARVTTLLWGAPSEPIVAADPVVDTLCDDAPLDEVVGRVATLAQYGPLVRRMERELGHLQRLGEQLNHYFEEIDQEMRLAGRLQRDFLPRQFPELPSFNFQALYRPASWVSGDMYDVFRVDERSVGIFVADAMGHGVAAGLLTMFFRQALVPKRIAGSSYTVVPPREVIAELNATLLRQRLPHCQFITAAYALLDAATGEVRLSRGGHPYPLLISPAGEIREVRVEGGLMGITDVGGDFDETSVTLQKGEKLVLYTDGLDEYAMLPRVDAAEPPHFTEDFQAWVKLPTEGLLAAVENELTSHAGSLHPADDVTMLVVERTE